MIEIDLTTYKEGKIKMETAAIWRGKEYATDKIENNYMPHYERILGHLQDTPARVLEIGVRQGGSCLLWSDFFAHPESKIIGLDIQLPNTSDDQYSWQKVTLEICDQNDVDRLEEIAKRYGPFDVIIDDASHYYRETLNCFELLINYLKPEGYYVIEDWGIGYIKGVQHVYGDPASGKTTVELVTDIVNDAPAMGVSGTEIIIDAYSALAFFRKASPEYAKWVEIIEQDSSFIDGLLQKPNIA